jgi:hypothetical protein
LVKLTRDKQSPENPIDLTHKQQESPLQMEVLLYPALKGSKRKREIKMTW